MPSQTTVSLQTGPDLHVYPLPEQGGRYLITNVDSPPSAPHKDFTPSTPPNPRHGHSSLVLPVVLHYYEHLGIPSASLNLIPNPLQISIDDEEEEDDDVDDNSNRSRSSNDNPNTPSAFRLTNIQLFFSFRRSRFERIVYAMEKGPHRFTDWDVQTVPAQTIVTSAWSALPLVYINRFGLSLSMSDFRIRNNDDVQTVLALSKNIPLTSKELFFYGYHISEQTREGIETQLGMEPYHPSL